MTWTAGPMQAKVWVLVGRHGVVLGVYRTRRAAALARPHAATRIVESTMYGDIRKQ